MKGPEINSGSCIRNRLKRQVQRLVLLIFVAAVPIASAQDDPVAHLPTAEQLATVIASSESRTDALKTMVALSGLHANSADIHLRDVADLEARFRADQIWVERLAAHYLDLPVRGSQLDTAAWLLLLELDRNGVLPGLDSSPLGPDEENLFQQLFNRSDKRLAAALLPEALQRVEARAVETWADLLRAASENVAVLALLDALNAEFFAAWSQTGSLPVDEENDLQALLDISTAGLAVLAGEAMMEGPRDNRRVERLRFDLLTAWSGMNDGQRREAAQLLTLANGLDRLGAGDYLAFSESMLAVISDMLLFEVAALQETMAAAELAAMEAAESDVEAGSETVTAPEPVEAEEPLPGVSESVLPRLLAELLPILSNALAAEFSAVDPRINSSLAAVFDAVQYLQGPQREEQRLSALLRGTADAIAQLALQIPGMAHYYEQPVREEVTALIAGCAEFAAGLDTDGGGELPRGQFYSCLAGLVDLARNQASSEELAGDPDGPFGIEQLRRELQMPPWQRVNFALGYLHEHFPGSCEMPDEPLPNPLEWAGLANTMVWLARQSPEVFRAPEYQTLLIGMRQAGLDLLDEMALQADCFSGEGGGLNDPVVRSLGDYRTSLNELVAGLREAELAFREERLKTGADVVLYGDAEQRTAYRSDGLVIGPCNPDRFCEMNGTLEATRTLIGQFPDPYLVADQTGMGEIEICYDNMQWIERRSEPVRPEDSYVANYYGRLSFDLLGRFHEGDAVQNIFGATFISPDEYHYLFAAATDEVMVDNCPTEWVGTRVVTPLNQAGGFRVVPNRLTYLAGARQQPSAIINANWSRGEEWREWFVTGIGVTPHQYIADAGFPDRVNQHLQALYQAEQSELYAALLRPRSGEHALFDLQEELTARKALVRAYMSLFYPEALISVDGIRGALEGEQGLLNDAVLRDFRADNVAVSSINQSGFSRLERFQADWRRQPRVLRRNGSVATSVAHAMVRLNALYDEFFAQGSVIAGAETSD